MNNNTISLRHPPPILSVGWATAVPWSSVLASGSCASAEEEPTATPTCSSASEPHRTLRFFLFSLVNFSFVLHVASASLLQDQTTVSWLHTSPGSHLTMSLWCHRLCLSCICCCFESGCLRISMGFVDWIFTDSSNVVTVACECFMFNKKNMSTHLFCPSDYSKLTHSFIRFLVISSNTWESVLRLLSFDY